MRHRLLAGLKLVSVLIGTFMFIRVSMRHRLLAGLKLSLFCIFQATLPGLNEASPACRIETLRNCLKIIHVFACLNEASPACRIETVSQKNGQTKMK